MHLTLRQAVLLIESENLSAVRHHMLNDPTGRHNSEEMREREKEGGNERRKGSGGMQ